MSKIVGIRAPAWYRCYMLDRLRKPKRPRDANQLAKQIVDVAAGEIEDRVPSPEDEGKNPRAVALGHLGWQKGGNARARLLTPERRSGIARKAALARYAKK